MKLAILGTRGIPNNYGGFEQFAEFLSLGLINQGFEVYVYNSHTHPYQNNSWKGVNIIHQYDPEFKIGTAGQFLYDLNCILDCRKKKFDIILQLGYTSSSIWSFLFPKNSIIVTNLDGLEWKRSKYGKFTKEFLKLAEMLAIKTSDHLVSDSIGIQNYVREKFQKESTYIAYGANLFKTPDKNILSNYNLIPYQYDMLIARLEPENSIEIILDGYLNSSRSRKFIVVANYKTKYGKFLLEKYQKCTDIIFLGSIFDLPVLNNLRYYSNLYFHGHTVGGTNPSLLEAMSSMALIAANENIFNSSILGSDAYYFKTSEDVAILLNKIAKNDEENIKIKENADKIRNFYSWESIITSYRQLFMRLNKPN
jgi:hypothetical protein